MISSVSDQTFESLAELFGALASPTRLRVFCTLLLKDELNVGDVVRLSGVPRSSVSHHFRRLRADRLVERRKAGSIVFYRISNDFFASLVSRTISWSTQNPDLLSPTALQIARSLCPITYGQL
jgi:ArsR family transcriptional regulator